MEKKRQRQSEERGEWKQKKKMVQTETWFQSALRLRRRMFDGRSRERDSTDRCSAQECVRTHTYTQHTRLLLDCGYSGLYPAKPPQANTVHSDMEIFYWARLWCMNAPKSPEWWVAQGKQLEASAERWTKHFNANMHFHNKLELFSHQQWLSLVYWCLAATFVGIDIRFQTTTTKICV